MTIEPSLKLVDDDKDDITIYLNGKEQRGWSYSSDAERRAKMLAAREYIEGFHDGIKYIQSREAHSDERQPSTITKSG